MKPIGVLCDFSISSVLRKEILTVADLKRSTVRGLSVNYAAPEMILAVRGMGIAPGSISFPIDMFSFAMVAWESAMQRSPGLFKTAKEQLDATVHGLRPVTSQEEESQISKRSRFVIRMAESCWDTDPQKRLSASQALAAFKIYVDS